MTILENKKRVCETCFYEHTGIFDEPCASCRIDTNSNWNSKEKDFIPKWMTK